MRIMAAGFLIGLLAIAAGAVARASKAGKSAKPGAAGGARAEAKRAAHADAVGWLHLVDTGKYSESWDGTSRQFQVRIDREKWAKTLDQVRAPLGDLVSRELERSTYANTLPGAPDGEYVVLRFKTSFTHKKLATETVTMEREQQHWKLAGYFIR